MSRGDRSMGKTMVDIMDRRMTRSLSNELQARAMQAASQLQGSYAHTAALQLHIQSSPSSQAGYPGHGQATRTAAAVHHHQAVMSMDATYQHHHHFVSNGGAGEGQTYLRNTSEEMFLTSLMNSSLVPGTPSMEAASLGFLDLQHQHHYQNSPQHALRGNSEELFHNWITTDNNAGAENSNQNQNGAYSGQSPSPAGNRPRQDTSELQAILAQQRGARWTARTDNVEQTYVETNNYLSEDLMSNVNSDEKPHRNNLSKDKGDAIDYSSLGPLKTLWFNATSPMTRSQSSELRRRYAHQEGLPFPPPVEAIQKLTSNGTLESLVNPVRTSLGAFARGVGSNGRPQNDPDSKLVSPQVPLLPSSASQAPLTNRHQIQEQPGEQQGRSVSDVVGLLKGSLERKKLQTKQQNQQQKPQHQGMMMQSSMSPPLGNTRQEESLNRPQDHRQQMHGENGLNQVNPPQKLNLPHVHSPSESSGGAPSHSAGVATSDGPSNSAVSVRRQALKRGSGAVDQPSPKRQAFSGLDSPSTHSNGDVYENGASKIDIIKKPEHLARAGSITSSLRPGYQLNEIDGATKKRRVERQRKMAEAKGRGNAPPLPADMQAAIKRCDALEKEVRSMKLLLSFMNRKDSEQTKRIEELEQQNEELKEEKDRLLEAVNDPE